METQMQISSPSDPGCLEENSHALAHCTLLYYLDRSSHERTSGELKAVHNTCVLKGLAEFKEHHALLEKEIETEEQKKSQIQADIQILTKRLVSINESLAKKVEERNEYAKVMRETEAAYAKILESSQTLLAVLKRESASISRKHQPT